MQDDRNMHDHDALSAQRRQQQETHLSSGLAFSRPPLRLADPAIPIDPRDHLMQVLLRSLLDGNEYTQLPDEQRAVLRYKFDATSLDGSRDDSYEADAGEILITFTATPATPWETIVSYLAGMSDDLVDTFCAYLVRACELHGAGFLDDAVPAIPEKFLALYFPQQGQDRFSLEQRRTVLHYLQVLAAAQLEIRVPNRPENVLRRYRGPILEDPHEILSGHNLYHLGQWIKLVPGVSATAVAQLRRTLIKHPEHEHMVKRFARYLIWEFAALHHQQVGQPMPPGATRATLSIVLSTLDLLEASGVILDRPYTDHTDQLITAALAQLRRDGILRAFRKLVPRTRGTSRQLGSTEEYARDTWEDSHSLYWWLCAPPLDTAVSSRQHSRSRSSL